MKTFERLESEVRSYCRAFPTVFATADGARLRDEDGREFIDFFAGAGTLNYGHNHPELRDALLEYVSGGGVVHTLDMASTAKREFLLRFEERILAPRGLQYKVQFPGPTGTNAVEAALKLARKVTGRETIVSFTNAFHGMTLGSLAVTGNAFKRAGAGIRLDGAHAMPFEGYLGPDIDTLAVLEAYLDDAGSGLDKPAAVVVETIQAEGGINTATNRWLERLQAMVRARDILLIVDDIQVGCGRTGPFFSFEAAGIKPDIVCLSKSLSGFGLPMAIVLLRPEIDIWSPGEHNGTFRGHNLAFVTATKALEFWRNDTLENEVARKSEIITARLHELVNKHAPASELRGRGLIQGIRFDDVSLAGRISRHAFGHGLIIETAGVDDRVLKLLPPLVIEDDLLEQGLDIIDRSIADALAEKTEA